MDSAIQDYLRAVTSQARDTERIGPFLATFSRSSTNPFLNYAIPDDGAEPSAGDVEELIAAYERRGLRPRLEYVTGRAPEVEDALLAAGFTVEWRPALMICRPGEELMLPVPTGIELIPPQSDQELLDTRTVQHEAYGEPEEAGPAEAEALAASLRSGGMAVLARVRDTGEPVGAGECTTPLDGLTELAGVAVRAPFRRRGIAAALTGWLARTAFEAGVSTVFLMANEAEERIYARAGFRTISRVLHISREIAISS